jgi:hypothetical protein
MSWVTGAFFVACDIVLGMRLEGWGIRLLVLGYIG